MAGLQRHIWNIASYMVHYTVHWITRIANCLIPLPAIPVHAFSFFLLGRKIKSIGEKFKSGFKQDRTKRYMDLLAMEMNCHNSNKYSNYTNTVCHRSHHGNSITHRRRKRFVSKLLCEKLAVKACGVTKGLCKGELLDSKLTAHYHFSIKVKPVFSGHRRRRANWNSEKAKYPSPDKPTSKSFLPFLVPKE